MHTRNGSLNVRPTTLKNGVLKLNDLFLKTYLKVLDVMTREEGQDLVEYALLITLVALAAVAGINKVATAINTVFSNVSNTLS